MTVQGLAEFTKRLDTFARGIRDPELGKVMKLAGEKAQKIAEQEASSDLGGDPKFSGWKPTLDTRTKYLGDGRLMLMPTGRSAGPWTVAERGRNQGNAGGFAGPGVNRASGLTARTKSGAVRRVRASKGRRWNGRTAGKSTASRALGRISDDFPKYLDKAVNQSIAKAGL